MTTFEYRHPIDPYADIELAVADKRNARKRRIASLDIPTDGSTPASVMDAEPVSQHQDSKCAAGR